MKVITMAEMLEEMETGLPFSISFVTFDKQRKTGGEIRFYKEVVLNKDTSDNKKVLTNNDLTKNVNSKKKKWDPNHYGNSTRSFRVLVNGCKTSTVKKFHIFLVLKFNDRKLIL